MAFHLSHIHDFHRFLAVDIGTHRVRSGVYNIEASEIRCEGMASVRQSRRSIQDGSITDLR
jgi:cell division ATPase FtsA